jgi:deoxyribodipyrimidine photolyase
VNSADHAGANSSRTTSVPESFSDFSRPWNKNTLKTQPARKKNPTENLAKQTQPNQELTSNTKTHTRVKQFTQGKSHKWLAPVRLVHRTGQTGVTWAARDEQHPRVNSPESKP